jgi:hypothetical protein
MDLNGMSLTPLSGPSIMETIVPNVGIYIIIVYVVIIKIYAREEETRNNSGMGVVQGE